MADPSIYSNRTNRHPSQSEGLHDSAARALVSQGAAPPPHHRLSVHSRSATFPLELNLTFTAAWTVIFAPSGTGKSTLLRLMAGLLPTLPATFERATPSGWSPLQTPMDSLAPERRAIAYAPQHASLFPHLTVAENVGFSARVHAKPTAANTLKLLGLEHLSTKRPQGLSGGERQLVSLARALAVPNPRLLLLDEPFSGVDRPTRDALLPKLHAFTAEHHLPVVSVTHDVEEALLLDAEVVRLQHGKVAAQGPARAVLAYEIAQIQNLLKL